MAVPLRLGGGEGGEGLVIKTNITFFSTMFLYIKKVPTAINLEGGGEGLNGAAINKIFLFFVFAASLIKINKLIYSVYYVMICLSALPTVRFVTPYCVNVHKITVRDYITGWI